jgi:hypothetical protein
MIVGPGASEPLLVATPRDDCMRREDRDAQHDKLRRTRVQQVRSMLLTVVYSLYV